MLIVLNVAAALCLVLAAITFVAGYVRRFQGRRGVTIPEDLRVEVLSRAPLAPKQGVAVIRVGGQSLAVSYGEGGVRPLGTIGGSQAWGPRLVAEGGPPGDASGPTLTLDNKREPGGASESRDAPSNVPPAGLGLPPATLQSENRGGDFSSTLKAVVRKAALPIVLAVFFGSPTAALSQDGIAGGAPPASAVLNPTAATLQAAQAVGSVPGGGSTDSVEELEPSVLRDLMQAAGMGGGANDEESLLPGPVGAVIFVGFLTLLPTLLLLMTCFTRILVVLNLLRQALGTQTAPPSHLLIALSLMLTGFVMAPTLEEVNAVAVQPWVAGDIDEVQMLTAGSAPFREFMLSQVRENDLSTFMEIHGGQAASIDDVPLTVVTSAFVTSELRRAFQIGFAIFLPFVVIDVVVASVLMSMGMFMLPPVMVSLPFKLLLFVLVDGWALMMTGLVRSFF